MLTFWDSLVPKNILQTKEQFQRLASHRIQCEPPLERLKPHFYILGIWKAGTTSLASSFAYHPGLIPPANKELFYFTHYQEWLPIEYYASWFPCANASQYITYESTAGYMYNPDVPGRIYNYTPNASFIIMLRDPAARAYSHYQMSYPTEPNLPKKFDEEIRFHVSEFDRCSAIHPPMECMDFATRVFLAPGLYYYLMQYWLKHFRLEQFHFVDFKEFIGPNQQLVLAEVQRFVGLNVTELPMEAKNVSPKRSQMLDSTKKLLKDFYKPHNQLLYQLLNRNFGWDDP